MEPEVYGPTPADLNARNSRSPRNIANDIRTGQSDSQ